MEPLIETRNLSKTYKTGIVEFEALKDANIKINKGEMIAIRGPSGCGKSTLLHLIGCLDRPTTGKLFIGGTDVSKLSDNELAEIRRNKIGFIFQFFYLIPTLTALQNVMLPMTFSGISKERKVKRGMELLKMVGLEKRTNHKQREMSGGEIQRVAIARAMANNPSVILADEPTGNLDSKSGQDILNMLLKLNREKGVTVIMVTHDPNIASYAQKAIYMKDGKIIKEVKK